jgi:hypothetical protein
LSEAEIYIGATCAGKNQKGSDSIEFEINGV